METRVSALKKFRASGYAIRPSVKIDFTGYAYSEAQFRKLINYHLSRKYEINPYLGDNITITELQIGLTESPDKPRLQTREERPRGSKRIVLRAPVKTWCPYKED